MFHRQSLSPFYHPFCPNVQKEPQTPLTGYFQRCIPAYSLAQVVPGHADVHPLIRLAPPAVHNAQEKEGATGQQHAMGTGVLFVCLHPLAIFVPLYYWGGAPLSFAVERSWLPLGDYEVRGVFYYPGRGVFKPRTGPCKARGNRDQDDILAVKGRAPWTSGECSSSCLARNDKRRQELGKHCAPRSHVTSCLAWAGVQLWALPTELTARDMLAPFGFLTIQSHLLAPPRPESKT